MLFRSGIEVAALQAHRHGHTAGAEWRDGKRSAPQSVEFGRHGLGCANEFGGRGAMGLRTCAALLPRPGRMWFGLGRDDGGVAVGTEDAAAKVER